MATVDLKDVYKTIGHTTILQGINASIKKGEFVVIVGPSGCGKSTLLRLIAGLDELSSGSILINNQCVNKIPAAKRDMAMVFQNYALYPHMTVFNNMAYGLKMRGFAKSDIHKQVNAAADLLQLNTLLNRKPQELSGGQKQRVAMGRAIVRSPAVFLFDEPLSNLDAKLRTEMRYEIRRLHHQLNTTSLYVTHDQTEAMTMGERVMVLNQGIIEQIGVPQELYLKPKTLFVAGFTGHFPLNTVTAIVNKKDSVLQTQWGIDFPYVGLNDFSDKQPLSVAVRAEHLIPSTADNPHAIQVVVDLVDDMGADKLVRTRCVKTGCQLDIRVSADQSIHCESMYIEIPKLKLHVFSQTNDQRVGE